MNRKIVVGFTALLSCGAVCRAEPVKVSSFGWDPQDSTRFIQAALDSDAPEIVLDRKEGPWITLPLWARSNKKIVFEPGVELQAKKGEFRGKRDYLFSVERVENVTIIGSGGARMKMHTSDYQKPPYEHSEWRYALRIVASTNVYVKGLSLVESGGDGILVAGNAKNVTLLDCICDGNHRQGISVIGAENLLIENCIMRNTSGTPPQAGIDFEPDQATQPLINCVMRNCLVENNRGAGYELYLGPLTADSKPLSVLIENCRSVGNSTAASVNLGHTKPTKPTGWIKFKNCTFETPRGGGISLSNKPAGAANVTFEDCTVAMSPTNKTAPVSLHGDARWDVGPIDDVEFKNLTVKLSDVNTNWVACYRSMLNPTPVKNLTGNVRVVKPDGSEESVVLDAAWCAVNLKPPTDKPLPPRVMPEREEWKKAVVSDLCPDKAVDLSRVWIPHSGKSASYVFYAPKRGVVTFAGRTRKFKSHATEKSLVGGISVTSLSGAGRLFTCDAPGFETTEFAVKVPAKGFYELHAKVGGLDFLLERSTVPVAIDTRRKHALIVAGQSPLQMWFAPNAARIVEEFVVVVSGGTYSGSTVGVSVFSPAGEKVADGVGARSWTCLPARANVGGLWMMEVKRMPKKPFSFFSIDMAGAPGLFFLSPEKTWHW